MHEYLPTVQLCSRLGQLAVAMCVLLPYAMAMGPGWFGP